MAAEQLRSCCGQTERNVCLRLAALVLGKGRSVLRARAERVEAAAHTAECNQERDRSRQVFSRSHDAVIRVYDESGSVITELISYRTTRLPLAAATRINFSPLLDCLYWSFESRAIERRPDASS